MIIPTIGRRVWYWPSAYDCGKEEQPPPSGAMDADATQPCDAASAPPTTTRNRSRSVRRKRSEEDMSTSRETGSRSEEPMNQYDYDDRVNERFTIVSLRAAS